MKPGFFFTAILLATLTGCQERQVSSARQSQQEQLRRGERSEALLSAAANQLADLPSAVDTELQPPTVILDASTSANRQEVAAVCVVNPNTPDGPINIVSVPTQNSRFRSIGVKSGDILKFYILKDETVDEERQASGLSRQLAMDFTVAQVIDENNLMIEKGMPPTVAREYMAQVVDDATAVAKAANQGMLIPAKIEVWRNLDERRGEINEKLTLYAERRLPPVGWEPSPDGMVLTQIVTWLNQWMRQSAPKVEWQRDPMLDTLDAELLKDEQLKLFINVASLAAESFNPYYDLEPENARTMENSSYDGRLLQEAVWLRDVSRWAQGDDFSDVARATALFDWTVRNIQLDAESAPRRPWQVMLHGRGTAEQRAWVFAMLCRQQNLDVVMLEVPAPSPQSPAPTAKSYLLAALFLDGQLYLYDPQLGLPIPGPGDKGVTTLAQAQADDSILRQLDLDGQSYPLTAESLKNISANVVADPFELTRRARQLESKLTGDDHLRLTTMPHELEQPLKSITGITAVRLWSFPFQTLKNQLSLGRAARTKEALAFEPFAMRPELWKARMRHFQGRRQIEDAPQDDVMDDHREAAQLYTKKTVRPPDRNIARLSSAEERRVVSRAKLDATLWLGLLSFDEGKLDVAEHWLSRPELTAKDSPWADAACYNLARVFEAQEKFDEAAKLLDADTSAQRHGNLLRARDLKKRAAESAEKSKEEKKE